MRKFQVLRRMLLAVALLGSVIAKGSDVEFTVELDSRILADLGRLRLTDLRAQKTADSIIVARIQVVCMGSYSAALGVAPTRDFHVAVAVLETLAGDPPPSHWDFVKRVPDGVRRRGDVVIDPYSTPGTSLAIVDVSTSGGKPRIIDTFVIPAEWGDHAKSALTYIRAHSKLFSERPGLSGNRELLDLMSQENPLLAIAAAQVLSSDPAAIVPIMDAAADARDSRQAALAWIALRSTPAETKAMAEQFNRASRIIRGAKTTKDLRGFALASRAASNGVADVMIDAVLLGAGGLREINAMSAADRLQPLLIRELRSRALALDPEVKDEYLGILVGLRLDIQESVP